MRVAITAYYSVPHDSTPYLRLPPQFNHVSPAFCACRSLNSTPQIRSSYKRGRAESSRARGHLANLPNKSPKPPRAMIGQTHPNPSATSPRTAQVLQSTRHMKARTVVVPRYYIPRTNPAEPSRKERRATRSCKKTVAKDSGGGMDRFTVGKLDHILQASADTDQQRRFWGSRPSLCCHVAKL